MTLLSTLSHVDKNTNQCGLNSRRVKPHSHQYVLVTDKQTNRQTNRRTSPSPKSPLCGGWWGGG